MTLTTRSLNVLLTYILVTNQSFKAVVIIVEKKIIYEIYPGQIHLVNPYLNL